MTTTMPPSTAAGRVCTAPPHTHKGDAAGNDPLPKDNPRRTRRRGSGSAYKANYSNGAQRKRKSNRGSPSTATGPNPTEGVIGSVHNLSNDPRVAASIQLRKELTAVLAPTTTDLSIVSPAVKETARGFLDLLEPFGYSFADVVELVQKYESSHPNENTDEHSTGLITHVSQIVDDHISNGAVVNEWIPSGKQKKSPVRQGGKPGMQKSYNSAGRVSSTTTTSAPTSATPPRQTNPRRRRSKPSSTGLPATRGSTPLITAQTAEEKIDTDARITSQTAASTTTTTTTTTWAKLVRNGPQPVRAAVETTIANSMEEPVKAEPLPVPKVMSDCHNSPPTPADEMATTTKTEDQELIQEPIQSLRPTTQPEPVEPSTTAPSAPLIQSVPLVVAPVVPVVQSVPMVDSSPVRRNEETAPPTAAVVIPPSATAFHHRTGSSMVPPAAIVTLPVYAAAHLPANLGVGGGCRFGSLVWNMDANSWGCYSKANDGLQVGAGAAGSSPNGPSLHVPSSAGIILNFANDNSVSNRLAGGPTMRTANNDTLTAAVEQTPYNGTAPVMEGQVQTFHHGIPEFSQPMPGGRRVGINNVDQSQQFAHAAVNYVPGGVPAELKPNQAAGGEVMIMDEKAFGSANGTKPAGRPAGMYPPTFVYGHQMAAPGAPRWDESGRGYYVSAGNMENEPGFRANQVALSSSSSSSLSGGPQVMKPMASRPFVEASPYFSDLACTATYMPPPAPVASGAVAVGPVVYNGCYDGSKRGDRSNGGMVFSARRQPPMMSSAAAYRQVAPGGMIGWMPSNAALNDETIASSPLINSAGMNVVGPVFDRSIAQHRPAYVYRQENHHVQVEQSSSSVAASKQQQQQQFVLVNNPSEVSRGGFNPSGAALH